MHIGIIKSQKFEILLFFLVFINDKEYSLGHENLSKECSFLCETLNITSKNYLTNLKKTTDQKRNNCAIILNETIHKNNTSEKMGNIQEINNLKISFTDLTLDFPKSNNSVKSTIVLTSSRECRKLLQLQNNRISRKFQKICDCPVIYKERKQVKNHVPRRYCPEKNKHLGYNAPNWSNVKTVLNHSVKKFSIVNEEPEYINISLNDSVQRGNSFLWYGSYENTTLPQFECLKIPQQNFTVNVTPNVNYLICLTTVSKHFRVNIYDCQPFKTKPSREDQPWLVKKSIPILIISTFVLLILAMLMGAFILYLSVHINPSLIRGSKRVIEVKRQDKAQILIMPRGYESLPQVESPLSLSMTNEMIEPAVSTLSCDTISTVSYVSANEPTPVEILTYKLNRLRELFQRSNNNIPALISSIPRPFSMSLNQRLPLEVDLLFEYEWYTITTTITTSTTTTTTTEV